MLFNSYEFIFAFLPVTLIGFYAIGHRSRDWAIRWLILASLFFYAWWRPVNVLIITPSILINYVLARILAHWAEDEGKQGGAKAVLVLGVVFNLCFLGYFKYTNFVFEIVDDALGTNHVFINLILPLGISFITFQKIAFLIDVQSGRVKKFSFQDYCTFVLFFPQLIAGPIVHYREMMPQFQTASCRFDSENAAVGLTLFSFGLFKKLILADPIALLIAPIYSAAAAGHPVSLLLSWMAALGFTYQIYFDFSGYTDMALGLARFFGIKLPMNFDSPLRSTSIIEFWQRWHITLTRFLTAYIYNPLLMSLTRRRMAKGRPGFGGPNTTLGSFLTLLMFPTLLTMFISGLWHGAGYQFIVWGLLHGMFLTINHAWRTVRPKLWTDTPSYTRLMKPIGFLLTFTSVVSAMVIFRSVTMRSAIALLKGMIGLNGTELPRPIYDRLVALAGVLNWLGIRPEGIGTPELIGGYAFMVLVLWIIALSVAALILPNTLQMLARYEPALGVKPSGNARAAKFAWSPSIRWAIGTSLIAAIGILALGQLSEFLYWQF